MKQSRLYPVLAVGKRTVERLSPWLLDVFFVSNFLRGRGMVVKG